MLVNIDTWLHYLCRAVLLHRAFFTLSCAHLCLAFWSDLSVQLNMQIFVALCSFSHIFGVKIPREIVTIAANQKINFMISLEDYWVILQLQHDVFWFYLCFPFQRWYWCACRNVFGVSLALYHAPILWRLFVLLVMIKLLYCSAKVESWLYCTQHLVHLLSLCAGPANILFVAQRFKLTVELFIKCIQGNKVNQSNRNTRVWVKQLIPHPSQQRIRSKF